MEYCYLNNQKIKLHEAHLHVSDLGLHRGYGVFDYMPVYDGQIPWMNRYLSRLEHSASSMCLDNGLDIAKVKSYIIDLVDESTAKYGGIKVLITGGYSPDFSSVVNDINVLITYTKMSTFSDIAYQDGVKIISTNYVREYSSVKTTNYSTAMRLYGEMKENGAVEILYHNAYISEASRSNVFFVRGKNIYTPSDNILHGVTRAAILDIVDVNICQIPWTELETFDEVFITSSVKKVLPITTIGHHMVGKGMVGPITQRVMQDFQAYLHESLYA